MGRILPSLSRRTALPARRNSRAATALRKQDSEAVVRRTRYRSQQRRGPESVHRIPLIPVSGCPGTCIFPPVCGVYPFSFIFPGVARGRIFGRGMANWIAPGRRLPAFNDRHPLQENRMSSQDRSETTAVDHRISLSVEGMTCASSVGRVEAALAGVEGLSSVAVNLATERADVGAAGALERAALVAAVEKAGYAVPDATIDLAVEGMHCGSCVGRVEAALKAVPGVAAANVNLATERATVTGHADTGALLDAIAGAGYSARLVERGTLDEDPLVARREADYVRLRRDVLVAALLTLPVFALEMGAHFIPGVHDLIDRSIGTLWNWRIQFVLTTLVLFLPGRRFFRQGIPALLRLAPDMNSLVALGASAAYLYSAVATFVPVLLPPETVNVYYEAAAVIVTLILLGRFLEVRARGRTSEAIQRLVKLQARTARVQREGDWVELAIAEVVPGDVIEVRPGERIPVDGTDRKSTRLNSSHVAI